MPTRPSHSRLVLACLSAGILLAACSAAAAPSAAPPASPTPSTAGPASFAEWTARQGFGGSSGVGIVRDNLLFVVGHPSDMTPYTVDEDKGDVTHLLDWLDLHPATACWSEYHAAMRDGLAKLAADYDEMHTYVDAGNSVPNVFAREMKGLADDLVGMPPPDCP